MMFGILCAILVSYVLLILSLIYGFWKLPKIKQQYVASKVDFSVIIPFRNEAKHLPELLKSIAHLNYEIPKMTFWFVDDASEDDSSKIIEQFHKENSTFNIHILQNKRVSNSPKKDAIATAISQIQSDWIVTTDADCVLPMNWLAFFNQEIALKQPKMIAAPVTYKEVNSFFKYFQLLDFLSLQGTTIGSFGLQLPFMCNGANLAYQKEAFLEVNGFSGNDNIASGDDVFLLEKFIQKWAKQVVYVKAKSALVQTYAVNSFQELISQRMRWASKSANYTLLRGKLIGLLVLFMNLLFCILPFLLFTTISWKFIASIAVIKILIDSILLFQTLQFTQQKFKFFYFLFSTLLYPFFTIFIFFKSLVSSYTWKNRVFEK